MKKFLIPFITVSILLAISNVYGQRETPAGAGDKNLGDDGIKMRSVEIERIKREAKVAEAASFAPINTAISAKFPQIKEDFEGIQMLEAAIIKAYTTGKDIDYGVIETSADGINKKAKRLDANLFAPAVDKKADVAADEKPKTVVEKPISLRDLIVELDTSIGKFVSSKIFGNIKIIEPEVAITTRKDLINVLRLSEKLTVEAKKAK